MALCTSFHHESRKILRIGVDSRWREMWACNGNVCGESTEQNSHASLVDCTFWITAIDPKPRVIAPS